MINRSTSPCRTENQSLRYVDLERIVLKEKAPLLFNISVDPYEKNDLATSHPDKVTMLQKLPEHLEGLPH